MRGRVRSSPRICTSGERCRRQESLIARQRRERRSALHYANDIRQNEWPAHAKRQWCHILRKSFLSVPPLLPSALRVRAPAHIHPEGERRRIPAPSSPESRPAERRVFGKRDNFVPSRSASHNRPSACRPSFPEQQRGIPTN